jgi:hypothetical protein
MALILGRRTGANKVLKNTLPLVPSLREGTANCDQRPLQGISRIRRIGRLKPVASFWSFLENLVWGLSPGSSIVIVALAVLWVRMYLNLGQDYLSAVAAHLGER